MGGSRRAEAESAGYGFALNPRPGRVRFYVTLCAALSAVSTTISYLAAISIPSKFAGVSAFYFAFVFYTVATVLFGGWGLIASYVGAVIGSVLQGTPIRVAAPFAVADVLEPLIPFVLLRAFGTRLRIDPLASNLLDRPRNIVLFLLFGAMLPPFVSGLYGAWILRIANVVPAREYWGAVLIWWLGAAALLALFVPVICGKVSSRVAKAGFACRGLFS